MRNSRLWLPSSCAPEGSGQSWENVIKTRSTPVSVKRLLREQRGCGVTYVIPSGSQRHWSPPVGFHCVYESYFQDDTKLWFPIPRLVTSYVRRRGTAISQFLNGSWRIAVALMVMAAEIDVTLSVRAFEELTPVNPLDEGLLLIKLWPNYNVEGGHPSKTLDWQRYYFYVKSDDSVFEGPPDDDYRVLWNTLLSRTLLLARVNSSGIDYFYFIFLFAADHPTSRENPEEFLWSARAVARLDQERWRNISWERIRRCIDRVRILCSVEQFYYLCCGPEVSPFLVSGYRDSSSFHLIIRFTLLIFCRRLEFELSSCNEHC